MDLTGKSRPESQSASWVCPNRDGVRSVLERGVDADALGQGTVRGRAEACNRAQPESGREEALGTDARCWGVVCACLLDLFRSLFIPVGYDP